MSGIVGSKLNIRGSGTVAKLGTDGQYLLSSGAGKSANYETVASATYDDDKIQSNIALLGFKTAANSSLAKYNLQDQIIDEYVDTSGIDDSASTYTILTAGTLTGAGLIAAYGNAGGQWGSTDEHDGGGGGGAGAVGGDAATALSGVGGAGVQINDFNLTHYWGGGGGGQGWGSGNDAAAGGIGGGGGGAAETATAGAGGGSALNTGSTGSVGGDGGAAGANTGGGGGGGSASLGGHNTHGGAGGDGIVKIQYVDGDLSGSPSGGTETTYTSDGVDYVVHTFTADGTFDAGGGGTINSFLMVGGGGSGGGRHGGGGGAGEVLYSDLSFTLSGGSYAVVVGEGGDSSTGTASGSGVSAGAARNGEDTTFNNWTAEGGGGGGNYNSGERGQGADGGSGGGSGGGSSEPAAGTVGRASSTSSNIYRTMVVANTSSISWNGAAGLTLQSTDTTASTANPDYADMICLIEDAEGTATLNTDIKGYISEDSGVTFTQGTLVDEGTWGTNKKIYAFHDATVTSGTDMRYKITTHNQSASKVTNIHATSIGWKA